MIDEKLSILKWVVYTCAVICFVVALASSRFQATPVRSAIEASLLLLCIPAVLCSRRIKNAGPFLIFASAILLLLGTLYEGQEPHPLSDAHFYLRWFELIGGATCLVFAVLEGVRFLRTLGAKKNAGKTH